jgi:Cytochrome c7 and related cytochrome c
MAQIFTRRANGIARLALGVASLAVLAILLLLIVAPRSSWDTLVDRAVAQPVPFSHQHHVAGLGLDCRYCHTGVEESPFAGIPPTETCMTCHSQIWTEAEVLRPVRESYAEGVPIRWTRVHDLPDYSFFNHAIHVNNGVPCSECHGRVDTMPLTWRAEPLQMQWCLECHRDPARRLRPLDAVTAMEWAPEGDPDLLASRLMLAYDIHPDKLTDCYVCHR